MDNTKQLIGLLFSSILCLKLMIFGMIIVAFEIGPIGVIVLSIITTLSFVFILGGLSKNLHKESKS